MNATVASCLTPPGTGAIATLGLRGPQAWSIARSLFTPRSKTLPEDPTSVSAGRFWLGLLGEDLKDEVVLTLCQAQPTPWVEIHCHGGQQIVAVLLDLLVSRGASLCSWQDWERQSAETPLRGEATIALAHALTARTAGLLLDQHAGALDRALQSAERALRDNDSAQAQVILQRLSNWLALGRHLTQPWRVVIAGPPNVGKSSLVNALVGYTRAVVSETPGTTRDVVTSLLALDGWPIELVDTAGLRDTQETLEAQGIQLAREAVRSSDLCLWLLDGSTEAVWPEEMRTPTLFVVNKIDLPAGWHLEPEREAVRLSAQTGQGLDTLCSAITQRLVPQIPPADEALPFTQQCPRYLAQVQQHLAAGELSAAAQTLQRWQQLTPLS